MKVPPTMLRGKVICACTSAAENTWEVGVSDLDARAVNGPDSPNTVHEALTGKSARILPYTARVEAGLKFVKAEMMKT